MTTYSSRYLAWSNTISDPKPHWMIETINDNPDTCLNYGHWDTTLHHLNPNGKIGSHQIQTNLQTDVQIVKLTIPMLEQLTKLIDQNLTPVQAIEFDFEHPVPQPGLYIGWLELRSSPQFQINTLTQLPQNCLTQTIFDAQQHHLINPDQQHQILFKPRYAHQHGIHIQRLKAKLINNLNHQLDQIFDPFTIESSN